MSGTAKEVGGTIFDMSSRNTVSASSTEMQSVIFSPQSDGRQNTRIASDVISTQGIIRLMVQKRGFLLITKSQVMSRQVMSLGSSFLRAGSETMSHSPLGVKSSRLAKSLVRIRSTSVWSQVQERNLRVQFCWSKGKFCTSMAQADLQIAGGSQKMSPVFETTALQQKETSYTPSALQEVWK